MTHSAISNVAVHRTGLVLPVKGILDNALHVPAVLGLELRPLAYGTPHAAVDDVRVEDNVSPGRGCWPSESVELVRVAGG